MNTERKFVIASNKHRYNDVRLQFWGRLSRDDAPRSFGGYSCDLNRCEKYTRQELERTHHYDLTPQYDKFYDEV